MDVPTMMNTGAKSTITDHTLFQSDMCAEMLLRAAHYSVLSALAAGSVRSGWDGNDAFVEACTLIRLARTEAEAVSAYLLDVASQLDDGSLTVGEITRLDLVANYRNADATDVVAAKVEAERIIHREWSEW